MPLLLLLFHALTPKLAKVATQLHRKFWGKSMKKEEQQWHDSQMSEDHRSRAQGEDNSVTEDANVTEIVNVDKDNDIIEGCYALDTGIRGIGKIWIHADYIPVYDYLEKHYNGAAQVNLVPGAPSSY
ncbi:hypothetical protein PILCRDRAFT_9906 [Piloderma croceum F 1598]|uniref:Uncharacterized protein n=1 Tax=Piloderma croceum (strain F 1598) TaxID=765440 RepID=A0A0C3BRQ9_PILCF|nr:hypothetical protein PILCRDRAFT_9906 [Piloderma croceum F 1598]